MHTVMMVAGGLVVLAVFVLVATLLGRGAVAGARYFLLPWLVVSVVNLSAGVFHAGYSMASEIPFLLIVFGVPALAAWLVMRRVAG